MGQLGSILAASGRMGVMYAERLLAGVSAEKAGCLARPGGQVVQSNHPSFIFGHLALYPARVLEHLKKPAGPAAVPAGYEDLFKNGAECKDDPERRIYPPLGEITKLVFDGYRAALEALEQADDAALTAPNPTEGRMRERFPSLGGMLGFYVGGHMQMHLGQMSVWRRMMGLPAA